VDGHVNYLRAQVDADFARVRRMALRGRVDAHVRGGPAGRRSLCFEKVRRALDVRGGVRRGRRTVCAKRIAGSVGRCAQFDRAFLPAKASVEERWKRVDLAFRRGEELPPVSLYEVGGAYFVLDGHHRVSVARFHGAEWIDAEVTKFRVPPRGGRKTGGLAVHDTMASQLAKQCRDEMVREVERNRTARGPRKRSGSGLVSSSVRGLKRAAGRPRKLPRHEKRGRG
jgi:hypothetical protein